MHLAILAGASDEFHKARKMQYFIKKSVINRSKISILWRFSSRVDQFVTINTSMS